MSQRGHEMNGLGLGLGVLNRIFFVLGSHDMEYWLGLGGKPHMIPLHNSLEDLANLATMSPCLAPWVICPKKS